MKRLAFFILLLLASATHPQECGVVKSPTMLMLTTQTNDVDSTLECTASLSYINTQKRTLGPVPQRAVYFQLCKATCGDPLKYQLCGGGTGCCITDIPARLGSCPSGTKACAKPSGCCQDIEVPTPFITSLSDPLAKGCCDASGNPISGTGGSASCQPDESICAVYHPCPAGTEGGTACCSAGGSLIPGKLSSCDASKGEAPCISRACCDSSGRFLPGKTFIPGQTTCDETPGQAPCPPGAIEPTACCSAGGMILSGKVACDPTQQQASCQLYCRTEQIEFFMKVPECGEIGMSACVSGNPFTPQVPCRVGCCIEAGKPAQTDDKGKAFYAFPLDPKEAPSYEVIAFFQGDDLFQASNSSSQLTTMPAGLFSFASCFPIVILLGLLVAAMHAAGRSPIQMLDFTAIGPPRATHKPPASIQLSPGAALQIVQGAIDYKDRKKTGQELVVKKTAAEKAEKERDSLQKINDALEKIEKLAKGGNYKKAIDKLDAIAADAKRLGVNTSDLRDALGKGDKGRDTALGEAAWLRRSNQTTIGIHNDTIRGYNQTFRQKLREKMAERREARGALMRALSFVSGGWAEKAGESLAYGRVLSERERLGLAKITAEKSDFQKAMGYLAVGMATPATLTSGAATALVRGVKLMTDSATVTTRKVEKTIEVKKPDGTKTEVKRTETKIVYEERATAFTRAASSFKDALAAIFGAQARPPPRVEGSKPAAEIAALTGNVFASLGSGAQIFKYGKQQAQMVGQLQSGGGGWHFPILSDFANGLMEGAMLGKNTAAGRLEAVNKQLGIRTGEFSQNAVAYADAKKLLLDKLSSQTGLSNLEKTALSALKDGKPLTPEQTKALSAIAGIGSLANDCARLAGRQLELKNEISSLTSQARTLETTLANLGLVSGISRSDAVDRKKEELGIPALEDQKLSLEREISRTGRTGPSREQALQLADLESQLSAANKELKEFTKDLDKNLDQKEKGVKAAEKQLESASDKAASALKSLESGLSSMGLSDKKAYDSSGKLDVSKTLENAGLTLDDSAKKAIQSGSLAESQMDSIAKSFADSAKAADGKPLSKEVSALLTNGLTEIMSSASDLSGARKEERAAVSVLEGYANPALEAYSKYQGIEAKSSELLREENMAKASGDTAKANEIGRRFEELGKEAAPAFKDVYSAVGIAGLEAHKILAEHGIGEMAENGKALMNSSEDFQNDLKKLSKTFAELYTPAFKSADFKEIPDDRNPLPKPEMREVFERAQNGQLTSADLPKMQEVLDAPALAPVFQDPKLASAAKELGEQIAHAGEQKNRLEALQSENKALFNENSHASMSLSAATQAESIKEMYDAKKEMFAEIAEHAFGVGSRQAKDIANSEGAEFMTSDDFYKMMKKQTSFDPTPMDAKQREALGEELERYSNALAAISYGAGAMQDSAGTLQEAESKKEAANRTGLSSLVAYSAESATASKAFVVNEAVGSSLESIRDFSNASGDRARELREEAAKQPISDLGAQNLDALDAARKGSFAPIGVSNEAAQEIVGKRDEFTAVERELAQESRNMIDNLAATGLFTRALDDKGRLADPPALDLANSPIINGIRQGETLADPERMHNDLKDAHSLVEESLEPLGEKWHKSETALAAQENAVKELEAARSKAESELTSLMREKGILGDKQPLPDSTAAASGKIDDAASITGRMSREDGNEMHRLLHEYTEASDSIKPANEELEAARKEEYADRTTYHEAVKQEARLGAAEKKAEQHEDLVEDFKEKAADASGLVRNVHIERLGGAVQDIVLQKYQEERLDLVGSLSTKHLEDIRASEEFKDACARETLLMGKEGTGFAGTRVGGELNPDKVDMKSLVEYIAVSRAIPDEVKAVFTPVQGLEQGIDHLTKLSRYEDLVKEPAKPMAPIMPSKVITPVGEKLPEAIGPVEEIGPSEPSKKK